MPTKAEAPDPLDPGLVRQAVVLMIGGLASLLNTTIVGVALDGARTALDAGTEQIQWVATAHLLTLAVVVPTMPWALSRVGARVLWRAGLLVFAVASLLCGAAWSVSGLIAFRVLQGIGGGLILPLLQTILATMAGPRRLGRAMALVAVPGQLAPLLGPLLGGVLIDGPGWRWVFWVSVPLSVAALILSWRGLPDSVPTDPRPLDLPGLLLLCPGLAALLYGGTQLTASANGLGGAWPPIALGTALLSGYARRALRRRHPLVDLRLFRDRAFALSCGLMLLAGASIFGPMLLLPLFYQQVRGATGVETGLLLAPLALGTMAALPLAGRLTDRFGPRPLLITGTVVAAASTLPYMIAPATGDPALSIALFLRGAGLGLATVPITTAAYMRMSPEQIPAATTLLSVVQRIGGAFGTALLLAVVARHLDGGGSALQAYAIAFGCTLVLSLIALAPAALLPRREPTPADTSALTEFPRR
ncbi:DHA2 family efflux MFS transporter permease subunit [Nonomuraea phyllanthi]|uniref:DHA2 family efflux MFS transporter permease subunit n=1 Tax=Nonomuraea phyllanthi TaxID=2219224 RepID=UPI00129365AB|nr:DHA2 family efflux MFS transporter permease subunit [Nonomuraea phyllanthi]QFY10453.1 DHA2 family efflux MFS transporter permease subunit [Nonomuraea phyllanthi]